MNWYYAQGEQRQGPVSDSELDALIAAGTVHENTLVWKEGMANWLPLKEARPAGGGAAGTDVPPGWIKCTATGRYFPPEEIVYLDGKPYSAAAKPAVLQGVLQTGSLPSTDLERTGPAWENRQTLGFFPAIGQTIKGVLLDPATTFSAMRREGGLGNPLGYVVLLSSVGFVAAATYNIIFQGFAGNANLRSQLPFNPIILMVALVILMPLLTVISAFIASGILHLSLMLCQGAKQPFETTFRLHCYVMGSVAPLQFIPICGAYAAAIWSIVALCIGLAKVHEINTGRAVLAVFLPMIVCCILVIFSAVLIGIIAGAQAGHH